MQPLEGTGVKNVLDVIAELCVFFLLYVRCGQKNGVAPGADGAH